MLTLATTLPMPAGYFMPVFVYGESGGSCPTPGGHPDLGCIWSWGSMGCIQRITGGEEISGLASDTLGAQGCIQLLRCI